MMKNLFSKMKARIVSVKKILFNVILHLYLVVTGCYSAAAAVTLNDVSIDGTDNLMEEMTEITMQIGLYTLVSVLCCYIIPIVLISLLVIVIYKATRKKK